MLVYHMVLSFMDNNDWYSSVFFSVVDNNGWYSNRFCLSWTVIVGIASDYVSLGQLLLVYHPALSVMDYNGWYITHFCLSWTISMCL